MLRKGSLILLLLAITLNATSQDAFSEYRKYLDLTGIWQFNTDTANVGIQQRWYLTDLDQTVSLPGTTDLNQKGFPNNDTTTLHLNRAFKYEGPAWYRKMILIPEEFRDLQISLFLERTKCTMVWIDSVFVGGSRILQSPQIFDITGLCTPGKHCITIRVDNTLNNTPYGNVHIYSDDTQTNWNGIIGRILLEASSKTYISDLQVYPDIAANKANILLTISNPPEAGTVSIDLFLKKIVDGKIKILNSRSFTRVSEPVIQLDILLGKECSQWDEFSQPIYALTAVISGKGFMDSRSSTFGMREFKINGTQFSINGRTTFLRGKHDACVFPLTGHPPMETGDWEKVFRIARSYGINHYRFHSYCPPEAAFTAADRTGIYLEPELPFWGGLDSDTVAQMLLEEGIGMLKAYANHPSFVMFSHGNEIWSGHDRVEKNINTLKKLNNRLLYTTGSNNNIGFVPPPPCSDFFVAARTPYEHDTILTHTRLSHSFADSREGGIINYCYPSSDIDYSYPVAQIHIPLISHEIGQYQVYPDFREIDKYKGVLKPRNLEVFRRRLETAGMSDQDITFHKASGAWAAICYKAEMEAALRTPGMAGFQLLDLQDYPGQGTALVGMLDAFMDSKGIISPEEWLHSCNDIVLLLRFPRYCLWNNEHFLTTVEVANYSSGSIRKNVQWELKNQDGVVIKNGKLGRQLFRNGGIQSAGKLDIDLSFVRDAEKFTLTVSVPGSNYSNTYPVWVYPHESDVPDVKAILITRQLNDSTIKALENGATVLFFPAREDVREKSVEGLFPPDFWNYRMFKGISEWVKKPVSPGTLGILTNPGHPAFSNFPTDFHTNWQWFSIIKQSNPLILDSLPAAYRPIVQVIDNPERNHKLGLIFEFKVGNGNLLVCMSQLPKIIEMPEARQLYGSLVQYMKSDAFHPEWRITVEDLKTLF